MPKIMYKGKNYSMGNGGEVDSVLSSTSENPVQNKIVTEALENKLGVGDIADWAKAVTKPMYTASEVGADTQGAADTALSYAKSYTDTKISDLVNGAPETLDTLKEIADAMSDNKDVVEALDTAVGLKANAGDLTVHINDKNNPHSVTKTQIGLGNVENKSSATIRSELIKSDITDALGYTPPTVNTTYDLATQSANGLMSSADKKKLDDIASGANKYIHPTHTAKSSGLYKVTIDGEGHVSATAAVTKSDITALGIPAQDTNTTYNNATQSAAGLESAADKTKLDGIETGANKYSLPVASSTVRGGVKVGYAANGKNYPVQLSNEQMYVNVPWTDTNTTYSNFVKSGSGAKAGLVPAPSTTAGATKYLREDGTWQVPTDTKYTLPKSSTTTLGGVKIDGKTIIIDNNGVISVNPDDTGSGDIPSSTLNECTPKQIQLAAKNGTAANYWSVGDKIGIKLNGVVNQCTFSNETYYAIILGFNHNSSIEGNNTIHFQFGKNSNGVDIAFCDSHYGTYNINTTHGFQMNTSVGADGGWKDSHMRNVNCPAFFEAMPIEWQKVITSCIKYTDNVGDNKQTQANISATLDKIWLLSEFEVYGVRTFANSNEQKYQNQYDYYKNGNSKVKNNINTACVWWLRSPCGVENTQPSGGTPFCTVKTTGDSGCARSTTSYGFTPCFKIS